MGIGFAPTWLRQVSHPPLLHKTTLTTEQTVGSCEVEHVAEVGGDTVRLIDDHLDAVHLSVHQLL